MDLNRVMRLMKQDIDEDWAHLDFSYQLKEDDDGDEFLKIVADLSVEGIDDDIRAYFIAYESGSLLFRAIFDEIEATDEVLTLVNEYNSANFYFTMTVSEEGYLSLFHVRPLANEEAYATYASECLTRLVDACEDNIMQALTEYTK